MRKPLISLLSLVLKQTHNDCPNVCTLMHVLMVQEITCSKDAQCSSRGSPASLQYVAHVFNDFRVGKSCMEVKLYIELKQSQSIKYFPAYLIDGDYYFYFVCIKGLLILYLRVYSTRLEQRIDYCKYSVLRLLNERYNLSLSWSLSTSSFPLSKNVAW